MTPPTTPATHAGARPHSLAWIAGITLAAVAIVLALSAIFDAGGPTPVYDLVPDPAGLTMPF